jgi:hypothetical protein
MKQEERSSISVSKDTRAEFMKYRRELAAVRDYDFTQDEAVKVMLEAANATLKKERER